ncbi:MAG: hypothetical protein A2033_04690 [Bacteroidetes bacterium GWA2_31_9]|nr:MAG: hypothetical protein A2033_04690 [Bacteroidetes bacterium GWA2_31_9]
MKLTSDKITTFFFTLLAIALIATLVVFYNNTKKVKLSANLVEHTQEVLVKSNNVLLDILNIESGSRGYVLTENEAFLKPFDKSILTINNRIRELDSLTNDNQSQQTRIHTLVNLIEDKITFTKNTIELIKLKSLSEGEKMISDGNGNILSDKIRKLVAEINSEEFNLLKLRKTENDNNNQNSILILISIFALIVIIFVFVIVLIVKQHSKNKLAENDKLVSKYARSLIEASLDPLVTINAEGKITDVNIASVKITGVAREKLIGTDFSDYFTEPEKAQAGYHQAFEKGFVSDYPLTIKDKNGILIDVLYNASVYKDDNGNIKGVFAAARDVTEQNYALEQIRERTAQYESVNKELEAFTYSVSHDLRAPLRAINGYAKILHEDYTSILDEDGMNTLNSIMKNSKRMGELIDDLLAFSRLGRKIVTVSEINMSVLVKAVTEEAMVGNNGDVEFEIKELFPAKGQQALIKQVWVNLISNAIKYSKHKSKTVIEIGSYNKDNLIVYSVKDNGAGFDMQYYDKLFGVFQRLHSQEEFEGTGIGLAIVQKIIQRHNGTAWAESKLNEGSCFYFSLPIINFLN